MIKLTRDKRIKRKENRRRLGEDWEKIREREKKVSSG